MGWVVFVSGVLVFHICHPADPRGAGHGVYMALFASRVANLLFFVLVVGAWDSGGPMPKRLDARRVAA